MENFPVVTIVKHPLIQHKLTQMRRRETGKARFRKLLQEISMLMGYEISRTWPLQSIKIETPMSAMEAPYMADTCTLVAILRSGLGMLEGLLAIIPEAREGHIGLYRDPESKNAVQYMCKLPPVNEGPYLLIDPMLATGNSAIKAVDILKQKGVMPHKVCFCALITAPEGIQKFHSVYPEIPIFTAAVDDRLDDHAYIVPGLGDAGDRMFGTL